MKYIEVGFKGFYHKFCILPGNYEDSYTEKFPNANESNGILTYGYYDREAGLTLEVLTTVLIDKDGNFSCYPTDTNRRSFIRIDSVNNKEFYYLPDENNDLSKMFTEKLELLKCYNVDEDVEKTRYFKFLDSSRDTTYIDDVKVVLVKSELQPEMCWVRITGLKEDCIVGNLLNEPYQNYGCHKNDEISFFVQYDENTKQTLCICDMN